MNTQSPVPIGVVGLGGYAGLILNLLRTEREGVARPFELVAVCSNDFEKHPERVAELQALGVKLFEDMDAFLKEPIQAVWLPVPIPLHRPFTEKALAAGKVVITEKPAAGSVDDVDAMIAAREKLNLPVAVGFQDVYDPTTLPLKRAILDGVIGQVQSATVTACWPRDSIYYGRASWAGAFKIGEHWVMDSPANNALSHYINLPLFILGQQEEASAQVLAVDAELYRVNPIENFDTCSLRLHLAGDARLLVLFTHACQETHQPVLKITGDRGTITRTMDEIIIENDKGTQRIARDKPSVAHAMLDRLANLVRGVPDRERGLATLEVARAQILAVNAASEASAVHTLADDAFAIHTLESGATLRAVPGIETLIHTCAEQNQMLHESGLAAWTRPPGHKGGLDNYNHFAGPKGV